MTSLSERTLRWGIIGSGLICADFCIALSTLPQSEHAIVHVGARSIDKARTFASRFSIENFSDSYKCVVEDGNVDIVYIGTINTTHKELSLLALNHGKAVLCEKPSVLNSTELEEVLNCAKINKVFYMEAVWTRCLPLHRQVLTKLNNGDYGDLNVMLGTFGFPLFDRQRIYDPNLGGSILLDIGLYLLTMADMMFGEHKLKEIHACGHVEKTGVDRSASVTLTFEGNKIAQLLASGDHTLPNDCVLLCSKANVRIIKPFWSSEKYIEEYVNGETKEHDFPHPVAAMETNFVNSTGLSYEAAHVRKCLVNGLLESPLIPHDTTRRIMGYLDQLRRQLTKNL
ncbi:trans-1,2-dihydrobenzene-1,2-diol dehydrogenase-like [Hydractinia symbiolongicarpus]|uniref:trans-1,2-dihydrobenzene-1,2-diol dehydrogenase-like n=1 Tax=Hydractinia symbiolongicarpus TaxID=13093 RepID=UPI002550BC80|nr:trans-1,2-dihydrobenzene-1,2-diol dehydrogenase-like [Hydractinia symbiolongicarpus]